MNLRLSLAEASRNIYNRPDWLPLYYSRGAVLAFLLDLEVRAVTAGEKDLFTVLQNIRHKHHSFEPEALFDYIAEETNPTIREFLHRYIDGTDYPDVPALLKRHGYKHELIMQTDGYYFPIKTYSLQENNSAVRIEFASPVLNGSKDTTIELTQIAGKPVSANSLALIYRRLFSEQTQIPVIYLINGKGRAGYIEPVIYKVPRVPYYPKITVDSNK
jgi:hypothetical protein